MKPYRRCFLVLLAGFLVMASLCGAVRKSSSQREARYTDYQTIPGVTEEEIAAVEALRLEYDRFTLGCDYSTECFIGRDGELDGFTVYFCQWLTELFDIPFEPVLLEWDDLMGGLESGRVDFTCELTNTTEREKFLYMTSSIGERPMAEFARKDSRSMEEIGKERLPRYIFLKGSTSYGHLVESGKGPFTPIFAENCEAAAELLLAGEGDAFFENSPI